MKLLLAAVLLASLLAGKLANAAGKPSVSTCRSWAKNTLRMLEKSPMAKRRGKFIAALAKSCEAVPRKLRCAASQARRVSVAKQAPILAKAAAEIIGNGCVIATPHGSAAQIDKRCEQLGMDEWLAPEAKADMRSSDFALLVVLARIWRENDLTDDESERLFSNFALSAALADFQAK